MVASVQPQRMSECKLGLMSVAWLWKTRSYRANFSSDRKWCSLKLSHRVLNI